MNIFRIIPILLLPLLLTGCFEIVDTGHRGVKVIYSKVEPASLEEGFYWYNPFTSSIREMDVRVMKYDVETEAYTRDVQQAKLHIVVNYNLEKTKDHEMLENVGEDWEERLIPQAVGGTVKAVIGRWDAVDLIANRGKAQAEIQETLTEALAGRDVQVTFGPVTKRESVWQPIDTAPKDGTPFLGWVDNVVYACWWHVTGWKFFVDGRGREYRFFPTHWMPLPELPKSNSIEDQQTISPDGK